MNRSIVPKLATATLFAAVCLSGIGLSACTTTDAKKDPALRPKNPFKPEAERTLRQRPQVSEADLKLEAEQLYRVGRKALEAGDFAEAVIRYGQVGERYPFTDFATQAEIEKIYALRKQYQPDEALAAADRFLREHPRHPRADYVQYTKGLIDAEREEGLSSALAMDTTKQDVSHLRKAFDSFALLIQKFPASRYGEDARAHMADLRNRIASNEMHIVDFYVRRGAYLAAAKRAEQIVALYPGAPASLGALATLQHSYQHLGLKQQAQEAEKALAAAKLSRAASEPTPAATTASDTALPPAAATTAAPAPAAPAKPKNALMRFFGWFDTSDKPAYEIVIPSGDGAAKAATEAAKDSTPAPASTTTDGKAAEQPRPNRISVSFEPYDDAPKKAEAPPPAADAPAAVDAKPADSTPAPQPAP